MPHLDKEDYLHGTRSDSLAMINNYFVHNIHILNTAHILYCKWLIRVGG